MSEKNISRQRRARRTRAKIRVLAQDRLCVHKTLNHIYVQLISSCGTKTLASASSLEKAAKASQGHGGNIESAKKVGKLIAERAIAAGVKRVAFDRSGYKFHGRIKALADAAREGGVDF